MSLDTLLLAPKVFADWQKSCGWRAAAVWTAHRTKVSLGLKPPSHLTIQPRHAKHPVIARLGGSSDMNVFEQIFRDDQYGCLRNIKSPRLILDLGANIGYSGAYFLSCFPGAKVIAVEPDPRNIVLCQQNLAPYGERAKIVSGAVWSRRTRLALVHPPGNDREWATQVADTQQGDGAVEAWDIPSLLALAGANEVDLLKIDIERSELELFDADVLPWLSSVRNICIELHGDDCKAVFFRALRNFDYQVEESGELTICRDLRPKSH